MQFPRATLERIRSGAVTLAFRAWTRPTVKAGTRLRTAVGVVAIDGVEPCALEAVTEAEAAQAGFGSLKGLSAELRQGEGRSLYRVRLRFAGDDGRAALAANAPAGETLNALLKDIARLDAASRRPPWTRETLELIAARPGVAAAELAVTLGREALPLKADVRRLKELGLTESLDVGYGVSPRGRAALAAMNGRDG